jgi:hypothetical protein
MSTVNSGSSSRKQTAAATGTLIKTMTIIERSFTTIKNLTETMFQELFPK